MSLRTFKQQLGSLAYGMYGRLWRALNLQPTPSNEVKEVLVLNLLRIGDTVVTLPTLRALRKLYPEAKITLVLRAMLESLVKPSPDVDHIIAHQGDNGKNSCKKLQSKLPAADVAVVLDTSPWVSLAAHKSGCKRIVAYNTLNRAFAATDRITAPLMWNVSLPNYKASWQVPYQGQAWYELAVHLGAPPKEVVPQLALSKEAIANAKAYLKEKNIEGEFVLCHPGSSPSYLWPNDKFQQVIQSISLPVVVGGAPNEKKLCEAVAKGSEAKVFVGAKTLADYAALISLANYVISVDTSAAHIAAAVGVPLTVLFGPGDPQIWGPRSRAAVNIVRSDGGCLGCKAATCHNSRHACMEDLSCDRVKASLPKEILK